MTCDAFWRHVRMFAAKAIDFCMEFGVTLFLSIYVFIKGFACNLQKNPQN